MQNKRWLISKIDENEQKEIEKELKEFYRSISDIEIDLLAKLLINRGINTKEKFISFLSGNIEDLHNPFIFEDMEKVVERILKAIKNNELIYIQGDRDVDGVTSTALLYRTLKHLKANVHYHLPNAENGYGLNLKWLESLKEKSVGLIITVDCGISAVNEVEFANELGIDVIITDHHEPGEKLPPAFALINPKVKNCNYPFKSLAGVGVVFKLVHAIFLSFDRLYNKPIVVLDIETTGLDTEKDEIIEIAAVKLRNGVETGETFHSLIKPDRMPSEEISKLTGISPEHLSSQKSINEVLKDFTEFIGNSILVAHNIEEFDYRFLKREAKKHLGINLNNELIDTLILTRQMYPGRSHKLSDLAAQFRIKNDTFHKAANDTYIVKEVFLKLLKIKKQKVRKFIDSISDLVALGTVADIMPLIDENRIIVKRGLESLKTTNKKGVELLIDKLQLDRETLSSIDVSWDICPILNAAGRLGNPDLSLKLLISDDEKECKNLIEEILKMNTSRKRLETENLEEINKIFESQVDLEKDKIIVLRTQNIEHGVTGLVANRFIKQYYRPTIIFIIEDGVAIGSARSIEAFNLINVLEQCSDLFIRFGGHKGAAGIVLEEQNIDLFKKRINEIASRILSDEDLTPSLRIDACVSESWLNEKILRDILQKIEPIGEANPQPVFFLKDFKIPDYRRIGQSKKHIKFKINSIEALGWNLSDELDAILRSTSSLDIAFTVKKDDWKGMEKIQLQIEDFRASKIFES